MRVSTQLLFGQRIRAAPPKTIHPDFRLYPEGYYPIGVQSGHGDGLFSAYPAVSLTMITRTVAAQTERNRPKGQAIRATRKLESARLFPAHNSWLRSTPDGNFISYRGKIDSSTFQRLEQTFFQCSKRSMGPPCFRNICNIC